MTTCPDCGDRVINEFAHAEECTGQPAATPNFSDALVREMIQEAEDEIRSLDYLATRRRAMLAWLRAVQKGTIKP